MGGEQGQQQADTVPYLQAHFCTDANKLTWGGVGVNQHQVNASPRVAVNQATKLISNIEQPPPSKEGPRVLLAGLDDRLDNSNAHGLSQGRHLGCVFMPTHEHDGSAPLVVGPGLTEHNAAAPRYDKRVLGGLCHGRWDG